MSKAGGASQESLREDARSLFRFLSEFTELRMTAVRSVDQYEHVLWLNDVPQEKGCFTAAHNFGREDAAEGETWVEINKPRLVSPPNPGSLLEPWFVSGHINDSSRDVPELRDEISVTVENAGEDEESFQRRRLQDHPEVRAAWEKYVEDKWWPWAENDRPLKKIQKVYTDLFTIFQRQQRLGEQYEVVLGLGLLTWQTPDDQTIKRHLITAQTSLEFEAARGVIRVGPAGEGARPVLEQDMLDPKYRPEPETITALVDQVSEIGDKIWEKTSLDSALKAWVHAASPRGAYDDSLAPSNVVSTDPFVCLAPAIILRRRTERSFLRAFKKIVQQLEEGMPVPPGVGPFITRADERPMPQPKNDGVTKEGPSEIYFSLEANEEQRKIVERLSNHQEVLVQGPPGTGKSHTIVNLICHLLASGNRVLVTSHTARALKVIKRFLADRTPEIAPLAVVLLGDDREGLEAMEVSVQGIMDRHNQWNPETNSRAVERGASDLQTARQREAEILNQLRAIRESETYKHPRRFESYEGTLQKIGEQLRQEQKQYGWIPDFPSEDIEPPLSQEEALELLSLLRVKSVTEADSWHWKPFDPGSAVPPTDFEALVYKERKVRRRHEDSAPGRHYPAYKELLNASEEIRGTLSNGFTSLLKKVDEITRHFHIWTEKMVREILGDFDRPWRKLYETTQRHLASLRDIAAWADETPVSGLEGRDESEVKADAEDILQHLRQGKGWGVAGFRPVAVKRALYLRNEVHVGGRPCESEPVIHDLIKWLSVTLGLKQLRRLWEPHARVASLTFAGQVREYEDLCEPLELGLKLHENKRELQTIIQELPNIAEPTWHEPDSVRAFVETLQAVDVAVALREIDTVFDKFAKSLKTPYRGDNVDPVAAELLRSLRSRDIDGYARAWTKSKENWGVYQRLLRRRALMERLATAAPKLAEAMSRSLGDIAWDERLAQFRGAWNWARARTWVGRLCDPEEDQRLRLALDMERKRIRDALQRVAAAKAWTCCFGRMTEHERQHLVAWSKATRKIGKGTGKYAPVHRRAARDHMEQCRSAIPAWIMPLYRVAESVEPGKEMFDVAIIDEASQSGPEALILTYLARHLVVVGDDKQISPDFVGIDRQDVIQLRLRHIAGLPHSEHYGVDYSFFELADIIYPGRIRLREHFRCMPEIIQFSNNLCYQSPPLIPLKQYGADRLSPVVGTRYVANAYLKGSGGHVVNELEAEALVNDLVQCCGDPSYKGKGFGVISLLGRHQARLIERLLLERLGPEEMERRQIVCGDAYAFQGDERDVIFLSMVSAPSEYRRIGVLNKDADQRRFNVAASRARDQMILYHSATLNDLSPSCLRYRLLEYCQNPQVAQPPIDGIKIGDLRHLATRADRATTKSPEPFDSWFEVDIFLRIAERGYRVIPQYEIAGYYIDLMVEGMRGRLAVECDGDEWHGVDRYEQDTSRQRMLERCGLHFWRLRGSTFAVDPDSAMASLWETLERLEIYPEGFRPGSAGTVETGGNEKGDEKAHPEANTTTEATFGTPIAPSKGKIIDFPKNPQQRTLGSWSAGPLFTSKGRPEPREKENGFGCPYREWQTRPLPDPRTTDRSPVLQGELDT